MHTRGWGSCPASLYKTGARRWDEELIGWQAKGWFGDSLEYKEGAQGKSPAVAAPTRDGETCSHATAAWGCRQRRVAWAKHAGYTAGDGEGGSREMGREAVGTRRGCRLVVGTTRKRCLSKGRNVCGAVRQQPL